MVDEIKTPPPTGKDVLNVNAENADVNVSDAAAGNVFSGLKNTLSDIVKGMAPGAKQAGFAATQGIFQGATSQTVPNMVQGGLTSVAGGLKGAGAPEVLSGAADLAAGLAPQVMAAGDALTEMQKTMAPIVLGTQNFNDVMNQGAPILKNWKEGIFNISAATGEMPETIARAAAEVFKSGTTVATGLNTQLNATEANATAMNSLGEAMITARNIGLSSEKTIDAITTGYKTQGLTIGQTTQMMAYLKEGIAGTGVSIDAIMPIMGDLEESFKFTGFNAGQTADTIADVTKAQKQLTQEHINTFKSSEVAASTYATALKGVNRTTQDYGQSLLYSSLTGGGQEEAFEMQFGDMTPEEKMSKVTTGLQKMYTGGQALTYESAKSTGQTSQYAMYIQAMDKALGIGDVQQTSKLAGLQARMQTGDKTASGDMKKILSDVNTKGQLTSDSKASKTLEDMYKQDSNFYKQMLQPLQQRTQALFAPAQGKAADFGKSLNNMVMGAAETLVKTAGNAAGTVEDTAGNLMKNLNVEDLKKDFKDKGWEGLKEGVTKQLGSKPGASPDQIKKEQEAIKAVAQPTPSPTATAPASGLTPSAPTTVPAPAVSAPAPSPAPSALITPTTTGQQFNMQTSSMQQMAGEISSLAMAKGLTPTEAAQKLGIDKKIDASQMKETLGAASAIQEAKKEDSSLLDPNKAIGSRPGKTAGAFQGNILSSANMNAKGSSEGKLLNLGKLIEAQGQSKPSLMSVEAPKVLQAAQSAQQAVASKAASPTPTLSPSASTNSQTNSAQATPAPSTASPQPAIYNGTIVVQIDGKEVFKAIKPNITKEFVPKNPKEIATQS